MTRLTALGDILTAVLDRGARLIEPGAAGDPARIEALCTDLVSARGEASGVAIAHRILTGYVALDAPGRAAFFAFLGKGFDPDPNTALAAAEAYADRPGPGTLRAMMDAAEPPRQELLRRLNLAPGGTRALVAMRADLRTLLPDRPEFQSIETDFHHLLGSWFNRGFLVMRRVDWSSPASLLEKIIAYEAVHEIDSWDALRQRVQPEDRRCYTFFHPAMPDEPLIFVEVALTGRVPGAIGDLLDGGRTPCPPDAADTAVFYSISNCQPGLAGISFGAFLIKQVAEDLGKEYPQIRRFVTLSPVPGLMGWLREAAAGGDPGAGAALGAVADADWAADPERAAAARAAVVPQAARYFTEIRRPDGQPRDPVARFHLGNGAELTGLHWMGDPSPKGLAQSAGIMVNYRYRLDRIEANHEAYAEEGAVIVDRSVRALVP